MQILSENSPDVVNFQFQGVNSILISYLCNIYLANKYRRIHGHTQTHGYNALHDEYILCCDVTN